jgi:hypothetical protein
MSLNIRSMSSDVKSEILNKVQSSGHQNATEITRVEVNSSSCGNTTINDKVTFKNAYNGESSVCLDLSSVINGR